MELTSSYNPKENKIKLQKYDGNNNKVDGCPVDVGTDVRWLVGKVDVVSVHNMLQYHVH